MVRIPPIGIPDSLPRYKEPAILGAVALAAHTAGHGTLAETQTAVARYDHVWHPDPNLRGLYDELYGLYLQAIAANAEIGRKLARL